MKRRVAVLVMLTLLCVAGAAVPAAAATTTGGGHWTWQAPLPHGDSVWSPCFVDALEGWAVSAQGGILHTTDGGATWGSQDTGEGDDLYGVFFLDADRGWVTGAWGTVLHTTDGGATWERQQTGLLSDLYVVTFVDPLHGWALGDGVIIGTTDGGATWSLQMGAGGLPAWWYDDSNWRYLCDLAFADTQHGWVVGVHEIWRGPDEGVTAVVLRTTDGGVTWKRSVLPQFEGFMGVTCRGADEVWAVGGGNVVAHSTDGGATWTRQTDEGPVYLYDITMVDALRGWAIGSSGDTDWWSDMDVEVGIALRTVDGGATWDPVDIPGFGADLPVSVSFSGPDDGRIMLESGRVIVTADGGATWTAGPGRERSLTFTDVAVVGDEVWAVGARGRRDYDRPSGDSPGIVWYSADGGATWQQRDDPLIAAGHVAAVFARGGGEAWVAGSGGRILHTADGGLTWEKQSTGLGITFSALAFADADNGWAVSRSLPGAVMRTTDGGARWRVTQVRDTSDATNESRARYFDVGVLGDQHVWLAGMEYRSDCEENGRGMVTRSTDGGASWTVSIAGPRAVQKVVFTTPDKGWALSGSPDYWSGIRQLLRTVDGGATWVKQVINDDRGRYSYSDLHFTADGQGWILASGGFGFYDVYDAVLLRTPDDGAHWGLQRLGAGDELNALAFADDVRGWAVGSGGTILATADGGGIAPVSYDNVGSWGVRWTNKPFTVKLTAYDDGFGLAPTRSRLDGGPWEEVAKRVIAAPKTHANDGIHVVRYQGVDLAGNRERPSVCGVIVDTVPPTVKAPRSAKVVKGRRASLRIKPYDKLGGYVRLRIVVKTPGGKVVKQLRGGMRADNKVHSYRFQCRLDKGRYRFFVYAKDPAGNETRRPASNWLTVR